MTDEEQALVQPFLFDPAKPKKQAQLINDGVYPLHGAFVRHGIEASQGGSTMHDTLGDVDVVLPYDARSYLVENNHAEVVLTEKFAIVVALNGEFDLAGGREREQRRQKQDQQWNNGRTGALQSVIDLEVDPPGGGRGAAHGRAAGPGRARAGRRHAGRDPGAARRDAGRSGRASGARFRLLGVGAVGPGLPVPGAGGRGGGMPFAAGAARWPRWPCG